MLFRDDPAFEIKCTSFSKESVGVKLTNFTKEMTREFVKSFFKQDTSDELFKMLWEKSEGNPLFLNR